MAIKVKFTEDRVRKLGAPDPSGKQVLVSDTEVRGLGILISGKTDKKSYVVSYGGTFQRRTIGDVSHISLDAARSTAIKWVDLMKHGVDPSESVKPVSTPSSAITLRQIFEMRLKDEKLPLRPASVTVYKNIFSKHFAELADMPLNAITPRIVADTHIGIFNGVKNKTPDRDGRTIADLSLTLLRGLFTYAAELEGSDRIEGLPDTNPAARIRHYIDNNEHERRVRDTCVEEKDLPAFWQCLDKVNPTHAALIRTMLLTGLRVGSARQLRWSHINLESRVISIPGSLMKGKRAHLIPIVDGLFQVLSSWRQRGVETSGYLFPSSVSGKHVQDLRPAFEIIEKATSIHATPHDLRRAFARGCKRAGIGKGTVADLLAHSTRSITTDYMGKVDVEDLRDPMTRVTDYLLAKCGANIIKLAA